MKKPLLSAIISVTLLTFALYLGSLAGENYISTLISKIFFTQSNSQEEVQRLFKKAKAHTEEGQYQQAEQIYQRILYLTIEAQGSGHPDLAQIYFELGVVDHYQQNFSSAKSDYENAIRVNPQFLPAMINLGFIAYEQGKPEQAIEYWQSALEVDNSIVEAKLVLAVAFYQQGKEEQGLSLALEALGENWQHRKLAFVKQNLWGETLLRDANVVLTQKKLQQLIEVRQTNQLNQQAIDLYQQGKYQEATILLARVLEMRKRLYTEDHPSIATSLNNLAALYNAQGKYDQAQPLYSQALAMRKRLYAQDHPSIATSLNNLASLYNAQGKYDQAQPLYREALAMRKRLYAQDHPSVATSLYNLALLYNAQGRYSEAEPLYQEALTMRKRLYAQDHLSVATSLNNLAALYNAQGRYSEAESLYSEALTMKKRLYPKDHPSVATGLGSLALLYENQGRYSEAEPLYQEVLAMRKRLYPEDHPSVAGSLNNLAALYNAQGEYDKAEPLYEEALAMRKRLYPKDHPSIVGSLNNLALVYENQGRYLEAETLYNKAFAMIKQLFPNDHPFVATSLNNLAELYRNQGRYSEAEPLYQEALAIRKKLFPDKHPSVATSLNNLGIFYQGQQQYTQALKHLTQASEIEEAIIAENLLIGSEQQKQQFLDLFRNKTYTLISFHLQTVPHNQKAANLALTTILRRKGRILDAMGQTIQTLRDQLDTTSQELFSQLASTQSQLASLSTRPLPNNPSQRKQTKTQQQQLAEQIRILEGKLSVRSAEFRQQTAPVNISAVQNAIPSNAALIEFIEYKPFNSLAPQGERYGEPHYAVYILLPDGQIKWQDLGKASLIDAQIKSLRYQIANPLAKIESTKSAARELDEMLMAPVRKLIGDATHLLISPDSSLNLVTFAALVDEQNQYLVENYRITYLSSGRDLLRLQLHQEQTSSTPVLLANPTFDAPGVDNNQLIASRTTKLKQRKDRGRRSVGLAELDFEPLPGTKVEGEKIARLIPQLTTLTEQQASENNLKRQQSPRFLHLATHGFFVAPPKKDPNIINQDESSLSTENPLLRSGLALAGFNQRQSGREDGVLTALEVTGLNLRGTRLVVLSACETGLGDVQAGEGVYGLRRAFTLAGAESQLMSLWSVSDKGTQELMVAYYQRLQAGEERGEALRQVQLEMLQNEKLQHPFFWAAFIPSGAWTTLNNK